MAQEATPTTSHKLTNGLSPLHTTLVFSLLAATLLTLSILLILAIIFVPAVHDIINSAAFQNSLWLYFWFFLAGGFPLWSFCALLAGIVGIGVTRTASTALDGQAERKYVRWVFGSALYNLIVVVALCVLWIVMYSSLMARLSMGV